MTTVLEQLIQTADTPDGTDPGDAVLGGLADCIDETASGDKTWEDLANALRSRRHKWEDVSYHGSPDYVCDACGQSDRRSDDRCPKAHRYWLRKVAERVKEECRDLSLILAAEQRAAYLKNRYGG